MPIPYPINLNLKGRKTLVVGGGNVAFRKTERLLEAGARVRVVSPTVDEGLLRLREKGSGKRLHIVKRKFLAGDTKGSLLVFACTDDPRANNRVLAAARKHGALAQSATRPQQGDFTLPSQIERGDFFLTISTGGASPALSKHLRERLESYFPKSFGTYVEFLALVRKKLLREGGPAAENAPKFRALVKGELESAIGKGDWRAVDKILKKTMGPGFSLAALGWKKGRK